MSGVPQSWFLRIVVKKLIEKTNKTTVACLWQPNFLEGCRLKMFFHEVEPLVVCSLVLQREKKISQVETSSCFFCGINKC